MKEIEVSLWKKQQHLSEIMQIIGMQYAFLSSDNKQCHPWIKCRDFLHDALRCFVTKEKESIFGFSYDPEVDPPLDLTRTRLLVKRQPDKNEKNASEETTAMIDSAIAIVRCIEEYSGIEPLSELHRVAGEKDMYIFEGAVDWMESTFMISLYTFLIRLGGKKIAFKNKEDLDSKLKDLCSSQAPSRDHDISYLKTVLPFIYKIIEKRKELRYINKEGKRLFEGQTIGLFHGYTGIVSLVNQADAKRSSNVKLEELTALSELIKE
jgi:hypothetical protein